MTRWVHSSMMLNHGREIDGEEQRHKKEWRWQNTSMRPMMFYFTCSKTIWSCILTLMMLKPLTLPSVLGSELPLKSLRMFHFVKTKSFLWKKKSIFFNAQIKISIYCLRLTDFSWHFIWEHVLYYFYTLKCIKVYLMA